MKEITLLIQSDRPIGDPDFIFMFNWHFLSIMNGLDVIWLFLFGWDFPTGGEIFGFFGQNIPPKRQIR